MSIHSCLKALAQNNTSLPFVCYRPLVTERKPKQNNAKSISYFTLFRFASKTDKILIFISVLSATIAGCSTPYGIYLIGDVFEYMINYAKDRKKGIHNTPKFLKDVHGFGSIYSCVGALLFVCGYLSSALVNHAAVNQIFRLRCAYLKAALNQDFSYYDLKQMGDFASRMAGDIVKIEDGISTKVATFVLNVTTGLSCIAMALIRGWKLALLCLCPAPVTFILIGITGVLAHVYYNKRVIETSKAGIIAEEVLRSIRTVYAYNGQKKEVERYSAPLLRARRISIMSDLCDGIAYGFLYFFMFAIYALSFYVGVYYIVHESDYLPDVMFSVFMGVMTGLINLGMAGPIVTSFCQAKGAATPIFNLIDNMPTINPLLDKGTKPKIVNGAIELRKVMFHYPARPDVMVLKDLSLTVKPGQSVALVGQSGSGKSTIIQLISRFYDVTEGSVLIDGIDVRLLSVQWLRAQIALVEQQPVLFNVSVKDNIRYGRESTTDHEIVVAAKKAHAHDFIINLPKGYENLVGEHGTLLSGGQKQRIAIARAIIRDPPILLLDEATSALDTTSEAIVQKALNQATEGRTTVIVAHRLATIRNVDLIYVLKDGQVQEVGNHEELMSKKSYYYNMVMLQQNGSYDTNLEVKTSIKNVEQISDIVQQSSATVVAAYSENKEEDSVDIPALSFIQLLRLNSPEWKSITIGCISSLINGFCMPVFVIQLGNLMGSLSNTEPNQTMKSAEDISIICFCIAIVAGVVNFLELYSFGRAAAFLTQRLRMQMFEHLLTLPLEFFDDKKNTSGALCARLSSEAAYVQGASGQRIGLLLQGAGSIGLALIVALVYEWRVALVALSFIPVLVFIAVVEKKLVAKESSRTAKAVEKSTKLAMEAVSNVRTVASLGREKQVLEQYKIALHSAIALAKRSAHCKAIANGLSRGLFNFVNAAALTFGANIIVDYGVHYKNVLIATQSLQMATGHAENAFQAAPSYQEGAKAAARIVHLLHTKSNMSETDMPVIHMFEAQGGASFQAVDFRYPSRPAVQVLKQLDLQIERGKTLALVGRSGGGKSTIVQLLLRYYDPDTGVVALDGIPLTELRLAEVRRSYGLVSQEPVLFDMTVAENIAYGDNSRTPSREEIISVAKQANIHKFVMSLPQGYDTNIGPKGTQLSGGQKQRVAIARALIRKPKLLLLDEATSALDTESEKIVQEALDVAKVGRTCVIIAHRLSTVRDADRIAVISEGKVAEIGTHQELMQSNGMYYTLYTKGL